MITRGNSLTPSWRMGSTAPSPLSNVPVATAIEPAPIAELMQPEAPILTEPAPSPAPTKSELELLLSELKSVGNMLSELAAEVRQALKQPMPVAEATNPGPVGQATGVVCTVDGVEKEPIAHVGEERGSAIERVCEGNPILEKESTFG